MSETLQERIARVEHETALRRAARDALVAMLDGIPDLRTDPPEHLRQILNALMLIEMHLTCNDCEEGECHLGRSTDLAQKRIAQVAADPTTDWPCGCDHHADSVICRIRTARWDAEGWVPEPV